jgi:hypothetical protein
MSLDRVPALTSVGLSSSYVSFGDPSSTSASTGASLLSSFDWSLDDEVPFVSSSLALASVNADSSSAGREISTGIDIFV